MSATAAPTHSDLACQFLADAYHHLVRTLCRTLPPPLTGSAEDLLRRDHAAIASIAALAPASAAEAEVAAQFVAASEQWKHCLHLAQAPDTTPAWAAKCRAQAAAMMRQANSALRLLLRMQAARRKLETDNAACDRAAWAEHAALHLMAEALAQSHAEQDQRAAAKANPPASADARNLAPAEQSPSEAEPREAPAQPEPDLIAAAERYAAAYPERAAQIRRTGKLPCDVRYFDPPEAALARALIAGATPALAALDRAFAEASAA